ncbi:MAG: hypothetical protein HY461_01940 [Parcubacteria group bacterium]|nr:hypothetical protein [Parcubacteria group bacterium]
MTNKQGWLAGAGIIIVLIIIFAAVWYNREEAPAAQPNTIAVNEPTPTGNQPKTTDQAGTQVEPEKVAAPYTYQNAAYDFKLTFPASWGTINVKSFDQKCEGVCKNNKRVMHKVWLTSSVDPDRYVHLIVLAKADVLPPEVEDYPMGPIQATATYGYFIEGLPSGIPEYSEKDRQVIAEVEAILKTFKIDTK